MCQREWQAIMNLNPHGDACADFGHTGQVDQDLYGQRSIRRVHFGLHRRDNAIDNDIRMLAQQWGWF